MIVTVTPNPALDVTRSILVGVDGSETSVRAGSYAAGHRGRSHTQGVGRPGVEPGTRGLKVALCNHFEVR